MKPENVQHEVQQAYEEKELNSNIIGGLIGGIIGGVVGAIPAIVALVFFHYFVGVLFAAIPFGAFFGWKLLGGTVTKITTGFIVVYTIVVSLFVWLLAEAIMLRDGIASGFGYEITIGESLGIIIEIFMESPAEFMSYAMRDFLFAFGSAIVGIVIAWRYINKTDDDDLNEEQASLEEGESPESVTATEDGDSEQVEVFPVEEGQDPDSPEEDNESSK